MLITKSDFQSFRKCPEAFWMSKHAKEKLTEKPLSDFQKQIIEQGDEVERWARKLFPDGILVTSFGKDALADTKKYLEKGHKQIFQASFSADGLFVMCDVLNWNASSKAWNLYEVKGTSSREVKKEDHYWDIAFQREVLIRAGKKVGRLYLMDLNKEFVKNGKIDPKALIKSTDITDEVDAMNVELQAEIEGSKTKIKSKKQPSGCACRYKSRAHQCNAFDFFYPEVPEYSVYDISRIGSSKRKLEELIDANILSIKDVPDENELSDIQSNQVHVLKNNTVISQKELIVEELEKLVYPIYFLDYETFPSAIPVFDHCYPFQQVPFQFSLHKQVKPNRKLKHFEYLHNKKSNPIPNLSTELKKRIGKKGSVIVWNKSFEGKCNSDMADQMPELKEFLLGINDRFFDLEEIFRKQLYVDKKFKGKTSIKYILPALVSDLSYDHLEIQDGGNASNAWKKMIFGEVSIVERKQIYSNLLKYCHLDTFAMYEILEFLRKV